MIGVAVLGSTGSIGVSTLDVIARHADRYRVVALTANGNDKRLLEQLRQFRPAYAVMADENAAGRLAAAVRAEDLDTEVLAGASALERVAELDEVDQVMAAIVGAAGLRSALAAARAGKRVLLANKESLVVAGHLFMEAVAAGGAELLPIDSEHNAIFQCMPAGFRDGLTDSGVTRILLTASGGPFRAWPIEKLEQVTPAQACAHPNWDMGRKISVDSATMMNKGLELIEACWLFGTDPEHIQVMIHPQSVVHSMVEYADGSVLAQLGNPDMRTPIAHAMAWPERMDSGVGSLNLFDIARLDFEAPDPVRFPCLRLASAAMRASGTAPAILNAANEIAVQAFLDERLPFVAIAGIIEETLSTLSVEPVETLNHLLETDRRARAVTEQFITARV